MTDFSAQKPTRSSSTSSRNDLFSASWTPDVPPPKPLRTTTDNLPRRASLRGAEQYGDPLANGPRLRLEGSSNTSDSDGATSSSTSTPLPVQPQRLRSSTTSLSRSASLRSRLPPPLCTDLRDVKTEEPLSPLHQSPSLPHPSSMPWQPPLPPSSIDVDLRYEASPTYLLGEGRYGTVFLAAYKRDDKGKGREQECAVNANAIGDALIGGSWRLCAAKRMSPDRESQTMGLREAFFLGRLTAKGVSPETPPPTGSVHIVKLIAVKEERDVPRPGSHGRSASEIRPITRQRSSTCVPETSLASFPSLPALAQSAKGTSTPSLSRWILLLEHAPLGTVDRFLRIAPQLVNRNLWERWAMQGAQALEWVHGKGVIHADVKPGNLLVRVSWSIADNSSLLTWTSDFRISGLPSWFTPCTVQPMVWASVLYHSPLLSSLIPIGPSHFPSTFSPSAQRCINASQDANPFDRCGRWK